MDGNTEIRQCAECGADFEWRPLAIAGIMVGKGFERKYCGPCGSKKDAENEIEFKRKEKEGLRKEREKVWRNDLCPPLYLTTDPTDPRIDANALRMVMEWEDKGDGIGIALRGPSGRCKTRMAYLLLQKLYVENEKSVDSITSTRLAGLCTDIYDDSESIRNEARRKMRSIRNVKYLLIDDLGKQKFTERAETELYDLIETRTSNLRPTFWTANMTSDAFANMMTEDRGTPIIRRLSEFSKVISL